MIKAICIKEQTFATPIQRPKPHFNISTTTKVTQKGKGPYSDLKNPPTENVVKRS